jgi:hypothetical protein
MRDVRNTVCIILLVLVTFISSVTAEGTLNFYKLIDGNYVSGAPDPNLSSIVITHGWQLSTLSFAELKYQENRLGFLDYLDNGLNGPDDSFPLQDVVDAVNLRAKQDTLSANVFHYNWRDAYSINIVDILNNQVFNAGQDLASQLHNRLEPQAGQEYTQPIHFVGHSAGTLVSASAIHELSVTEYLLQPTQLTVVDGPLDFMSDSTYHSLLPKGSVSYVDNYYGSGALAFGGPIDNTAPGDGGVSIPGLTHSDMHSLLYSPFIEGVDLGVLNPDMPDDWISPILGDVNFNNRPGPQTWQRPLTKVLWLGGSGNWSEDTKWNNIIENEYPDNTPAGTIIFTGPATDFFDVTIDTGLGSTVTLNVNSTIDTLLIGTGDTYSKQRY